MGTHPIFESDFDCLTDDSNDIGVEHHQLDDSFPAIQTSCSKEVEFWTRQRRKPTGSTRIDRELPQAFNFRSNGIRRATIRRALQLQHAHRSARVQPEIK